MDESKPLLDSDSSEDRKTIYKRRWWILAIFALINFNQSLIWNTWGPIAQSAKVVFNWSDGQIGMLPNWGNIGFIVTVLITSYSMDEKGLRLSVLVCSGLMLAGAGSRCVTSTPEYATWLMNIAAILNGIAGTAFFAGPPLLASVWFPMEQRATATAIGSFSNYAGVAVAFVVGPQLVDAPLYKNVTSVGNKGVTSRVLLSTTHTNSTHLEVVNLAHLRDQIMWLMYYECIAAGVLFLAAVIYFPDRPPKPPSYTASVSRVEYTQALCQIARNCPVWLISMAFALPLGVYGVWATVIDVILDPVGVSQTEVGWIGFYANMAGCVGSLFIARFSDIFMKHMKLFLVCLYLGGAGSCIWFTLICIKVLSFSTVQLYISCIIGCVFLNGGVPLFYELTCEASYPIAEGITGAFLTLLNNLFGVFFLLALQIPNIGTSWMNWTLIGSIAAGLLFLFIFPESYRRTDLDINVTIDVPGPSDSDFKISDTSFSQQSQILVKENVSTNTPNELNSL